MPISDRAIAQASEPAFRCTVCGTILDADMKPCRAAELDAQPSIDWQEEYSDWYEGTRAMLRDAAAERGAGAS